MLLFDTKEWQKCKPSSKVNLSVTITEFFHKELFSWLTNQGAFVYSECSVYITHLLWGQDIICTLAHLFTVYLRSLSNYLFFYFVQFMKTFIFRVCRKLWINTTLIVYRWLESG